MTKLAPLAAALLLGLAAGPGLAQQPGQSNQQGQTQKAQPQPRPQLPNDQRPRAEEHDSSSRTIGRGDTTSIGEQHGRPAGDALARPADPNTAAPADGMKPSARKGDTAATSAKTGVGQGSMGEDQGANRRPSTAERPVGPDESHRVDPGGRTPAKRADDGRNNPPPGSSGSSGK